MINNKIIIHNSLHIAQGGGRPEVGGASVPIVFFRCWTMEFGDFFLFISKQIIYLIVSFK
jgi:hypothetical protein